MNISDIKYYVRKCKLKSLVSDTAICPIIHEKATVLSKIFVQISFLMYFYVLHCCKNKIPIDIDTTIIRQFGSLILNPEVTLGRVKKKYAQNPDNQTKIAMKQNRLNVIKKYLMNILNFQNNLRWKNH